MQSLHQGKSAGLSCPPRHPSRSSSARQSHGSTPSFLRLALDCISLFSPVVLGPAGWGLSSGPAKSFKSGGSHVNCSRQHVTPRTWRASEAVAVLLLCSCDMVKLARKVRDGVRLAWIYQRVVFVFFQLAKRSCIQWTPCQKLVWPCRHWKKVLVCLLLRPQRRPAVLWYR
jgi:hypothetical protein